MKKRAKGMATLLAIALLTASWTAAASAAEGAAVVAPADGWSALKGKTAAERKLAYEGMTFPGQSWEVGKFLSVDPLVVVTELPKGSVDVVAKLSVWTGVLSRVDAGLISSWDEVWVGPDGGVTFAIADMDRAIPDYFLTETQGVFKTLEYAGKYPWVSIPTDLEAAKAGQAEVPASGSVDLYGSLAAETKASEEPASADIVTVPSVKPLPVLPDKVRAKRIFQAVTVAATPKDVEKHWAKANILDLMSKGVVQGFSDGTILPQKTLSRAEFATLLVRGMQFDVAGAAKSSYADAANHWASKSIGKLEALGIVPKAAGKAKFGPDSKISRIEMVRMIAAAMKTLGRDDAGAEVAFNDTAKLGESDELAVRLAVNYGIMTGYEGGRFLPDNSLTRAEAFVVVSRLIEW